MQTRLDRDSAEWLSSLSAEGHEKDDAIARLHEMLLRVANREVHRRGARIGIHGPELDDLAHQAAGDATMAILRKLDGFRGESRFTTWAYRFAILEVASKIGRHQWQTRTVPYDVEDWDRLPARFGLEPAQQAEWQDLASEIQRAVKGELTPRQRQIFVAIVLNNVPLDALVAELGSSRNAIYKTLFDARRRLHGILVANGYVDAKEARSP
jgi:RNA polymerase sigma-70 factor, ECF subfamily